MEQNLTREIVHFISFLNAYFKNRIQYLTMLKIDYFASSLNRRISEIPLKRFYGKVLNLNIVIFFFTFHIFFD